MHGLPTWISLALIASIPSPPAKAPTVPAPLDAAVWTAEGRPVQLKSYWGRPTVVIYESRGTTELNRALKDALWHRGHDLATPKDAAQVLGVVALSEYDWFPARSIAERVVRERQARVGIPVLIDWKGELAKGEWSLDPKTSSVLVLDHAGTVVFRAAGTLTEEQRNEVFGLLERLASRRELARAH